MFCPKTGFEKLNKVSQIFSGNANIDEALEPLSMLDILSLKYAPIISCDVEHVFFEYKAILVDNQRSFSLRTCGSMSLLNVTMICSVSKHMSPIFSCL